MRTGETLTLRMTGDASGALVAVAGELDGALRSRLRDAMRSLHLLGVTRVRLDLSRASIADTLGLAVLVREERLLRARGGSLVLLDPTVDVRRLLRITGLDRRLAVAAAAGLPPAELRTRSTAVPHTRPPAE